jgi:hypothetical protein
MMQLSARRAARGHVGLVITGARRTESAPPSSRAARLRGAVIGEYSQPGFFYTRPFLGRKRGRPTDPRGKRSPVSAGRSQATAIRPRSAASYSHHARRDAATPPSHPGSSPARRRTAPVTACTVELPEICPELPLAAAVDCAVLSCTAGIRKPDHRLLNLVSGELGACRRLPVRRRRWPP